MDGGADNLDDDDGLEAPGVVSCDLPDLVTREWRRSAGVGCGSSVLGEASAPEMDSRSEGPETSPGTEGRGVPRSISFTPLNIELLKTCMSVDRFQSWKRSVVPSNLSMHFARVARLLFDSSILQVSVSTA